MIEPDIPVMFLCQNLGYFIETSAHFQQCLCQQIQIFFRRCLDVLCGDTTSCFKPTWSFQNTNQVVFDPKSIQTRSSALSQHSSSSENWNWRNFESFIITSSANTYSGYGVESLNTISSTSSSIQRSQREHQDHLDSSDIGWVSFLFCVCWRQSAAPVSFTVLLQLLQNWFSSLLNNNAKARRRRRRRRSRQTGWLASHKGTDGLPDLISSIKRKDHRRRDTSRRTWESRAGRQESSAAAQGLFRERDGNKQV